MEYININDQISINNYIRLNPINNIISNNSNLIYNYNSKNINSSKINKVNEINKLNKTTNQNSNYRNKTIIKNKKEINNIHKKVLKKNNSTKMMNPLNIKTNFYKNKSYIINHMNNSTKKAYKKTHNITINQKENGENTYINNSKNKNLGNNLSVKKNNNFIFSIIKAKKFSPVKLIYEDQKEKENNMLNNKSDIIQEMKIQLYNKNKNKENFTDIINNLQNENKKLLKEKNFCEEKIKYLNSLIYHKNGARQDTNYFDMNKEIEELYLEYRNEKNNLVGLKEINGELLLLREENNFLKNENKSLKNEKERISINNSDKIKILIQDNKDLKNIYEELEKECKQLENTLHLKNNDIDSKNNEIAQMKEENNILQNNIKKYEEMIKDLNNKINDNEKKIMR